MSSILSEDHHRCAMREMSMGQVLNVQNVIVHHRQKWLQGAIFANNGLEYQGKSHMKTLIQIFHHTEKSLISDCFPKKYKRNQLIKSLLIRLLFVYCWIINWCHQGKQCSTVLVLTQDMGHSEDSLQTFDLITVDFHNTRQ